jgi:hypothetical protein
MTTLLKEVKEGIAVLSLHRPENQRYASVLRVFASLLRGWRTGHTRALGPSIVYLKPHTTASFMVRRSPLRLSCFSGALWVTCDCDPQDYCLTAGQHFAARSRGLLVVHAFSASRFAVQRSKGTATRVGRRPTSSDPELAV